MTDDEKQIVYMLAHVWNQFMTLPIEHGDDTAEFRHGIHALQSMILARAGRREINATAYDPAKWTGWTAQGEAWLAAGAPPLSPRPPHPSR